MKKIIFLPVLVFGLALSGFFAVQGAEAKTVKNAIVEKIDYDAKTLEAVKKFWEPQNHLLKNKRGRCDQYRRIF